MDFSLEQLRFDNRFTEDLPADPLEELQPRQVPNASYSRVRPRRASQPQLLAYSSPVLQLLGMAETAASDPAFTEIFVGNETLPGMDLHAARYGGHQFGHWADQLGDGRAIVLGEVLTPDHGRQTLQLKGAGPTPYSRRADGLAVLRSSLREFLCSEAMHQLGVPSTRALSLISTGDQVLRDMFYNGHPEMEPGAVVCRVAPSFLRFGNYEIHAAHREHELLRQLLSHTLRVHFPHLLGENEELQPECIARWYREVVQLTADMIVEWQRVGFVHGVMNTDNMSIHGLTIDYGPYGWLEDYDPSWTPNTTDAQGRRYAFGQQPAIAQWNLAQLGNALSSVVEDPALLQEGLNEYGPRFQSRWHAMMASKLGLRSLDTEQNSQLISELLQLLRSAETDMTLFYRALAELPLENDCDDEALLAPLADCYYRPEQLSPEHREQSLAWLHRYRCRVRQDSLSDAERKASMNRVNPLYVLRNYLAQIAIEDAARGNLQELQELQSSLAKPYDEQPGRERHAQKRPEWARNRPGCSQLSCSS
ncbi:MAG: hypothetical protein CSA62_09660 [Planctomycetota bacterium]|nr:MAG: hypothetical protein CSA62_09660 [Planctomycetota bacterium]